MPTDGVFIVRTLQFDFKLRTRDCGFRDMVSRSTVLDYDDAVIDRYDTTGNKHLPLDRLGSQRDLATGGRVQATIPPT